MNEIPPWMVLAFFCLTGVFILSWLMGQARSGKESLRHLTGLAFSEAKELPPEMQDLVEELGVGVLEGKKMSVGKGYHGIHNGIEVLTLEFREKRSGNEKPSNRIAAYIKLRKSYPQMVLMRKDKIPENLIEGKVEVLEPEFNEKYALISPNPVEVLEELSAEKIRDLGKTKIIGRIDVSDKNFILRKTTKRRIDSDFLRKLLDRTVKVVEALN